MNTFLIHQLLSRKKIFLYESLSKKIQSKIYINFTKTSNCFYFLPNTNLNSNLLLKKEKKIFSCKVKVKDCELISPEIFFFFFKPLFEFHHNLDTFQKIISRINLIYRHQNFYFSKLKFQKVEKQEDSTVIHIDADEPKIKNFFFSNNSKKKKKKKKFFEIFNFNSGKNFNRNRILIKKINETNLFSKIDVLTQPFFSNDKNKFLDLDVNINEKSSLSYTPEINFFGNDFSSSILIKEKNFLKKMLNLSGKIEIKKNMESRCNFFFLLQGEVFKTLNPEKKLRLNYIKNDKNEISNKISLVFNKKKNLKTKFDCLYSKNLPFDTSNALENFSLGYSITATPPYSGNIKMDTKFDLANLMNSQNQIIFTMRLKNFSGPYFLEKIFFKAKIFNEIFMGSNDKKFDHIFIENPEFNFLDHKFKDDQHLNGYGKKSSFFFLKSFHQIPVSFCIFSSVFSGKKGLKMFNTTSYGIKITYKNFLNFYIWKNKKKKKKIQLFF
ncbi:hypothetical protein CMESO_546 (nucleomorph) [Chroomonas mesostigmatica CCMP1168]|uniref:Uncharacterized protein n=1 Tax=Chroomonas mesostigmatica CCMP1168 TaxID=1195612 RepID=J7G2J0_9CRYP|nr:hypothetical protein CMESO_546 [Chroomonas mesostigmatica CCMP1168]